MTRQPNGTLHWHLAEIASALKITPEDVRLYFTDGRTRIVRFGATAGA
jgi:hypothetical protein